MHDSVPLMIGY